eukprot:PhM_4_TR15916/c2_g1_i1/m.3342
MFACETGNLSLCQLLVCECRELLTMYDEENRSPLYRAATRGHIALVRYFLAEEPKLLDVCRRGGITVMHIACKNGHLDIVKYLAEIHPQLVHELTDQKKSSLALATDHRAWDVAKFLNKLLLAQQKTDNPLLGVCSSTMGTDSFSMPPGAEDDMRDSFGSRRSFSSIVVMSPNNEQLSPQPSPICGRSNEGNDLSF